ncbi:hypothetical protein GCM10009609_00100 [Pseudonocardia aurantiaca]
MVIYPIRNDVDGNGNQLINWVAELETPQRSGRDWTRDGSVDDMIGPFAEGDFDWLDVPGLIRSATQVLEYPMVDQIPVDRLHDRRGRLVPVSGHEGEERVQCLRVQRRVGAVAVRGACGGRKDAGRLVVPDRLCGQTVRSRQVNRPELSAALKVPCHRSADIDEKFPRWFNDTV